MNPTIADPTADTPLPYLDMGTGFLIGLAVGYVLKKSFKLMLIFMGLGIISLFFLEREGFVMLNESQIEHSVSKLATLFQEFTAFLKSRLEQFHASKSVSTIAGFLLGLKMG